MRRLSSGKDSRPHQPVALDDAPRDREEQREMDVRGRLGHDRIDHGDGDAPRRRLGDVDIGRRDLHRGDRAQAPPRPDDFPVHLVMKQAEEDVELRNPLEQLALGRDVQRVGVDFDLGDGAQPADSARSHRLGDEDPGAHLGRLWL